MLRKIAPLLIIIIALLLVFIVSLLPLSEWTNGHIKDYDLLGDIKQQTADSTQTEGEYSVEGIDPELFQSLGITKSTEPEYIDTIISPVKPSRVGDLVQIEDYTTNGVGLANFKKALGSGRVARIAVVGDSFLEGDIFAQDLRELLQNAYGGEGVGWVNMQTLFSNFRRSVKQTGSGWKNFIMNKGADSLYMDLAEQYAQPQGKATSTYAGTDLTTHTSQWSVSRFLFVSSTDGTVDVMTDDSEWETRNIEGSDSVQCIEINRPVSKFAVRTAVPGLKGLGVWLDGTSGVSVDCMSSRGFSGATLKKINVDLCRQMSQYIDYDLIVIFFGINAMSPGQTDFNVYASNMVKVVNHVRKCYPNSDVLVMGISDRGERSGSGIKSMKGCPFMVSAQRDVARRSHCLFWDTREAMGGDNSVVEWNREGYINKDYTHFTHKGGGRLAQELFNALQNALK